MLPVCPMKYLEIIFFPMFLFCCSESTLYLLQSSLTGFILCHPDCQPGGTVLVHDVNLKLKGKRLEVRKHFVSSPQPLQLDFEDT